MNMYPYTTIDPQAFANEQAMLQQRINQLEQARNQQMILMRIFATKDRPSCSRFENLLIRDDKMGTTKNIECSTIGA